MSLLSEIDERIVSLEAAVIDLRQREREAVERIAELKRSLRTAAVRSILATASLKTRAPTSEYALWPAGLMAVAAAVGAALFFMLAFLMTSSTAVRAIVTVCGAAGAVGAAGWLLFHSDEHELRTTRERSRGDLDRLRPALASERAALKVWQEKRARAAAELKSVAESITMKRRQLLQEDWKSMRSVEFEQFLARACELLGYQVETTKTTGDQGIDLIVQRTGDRIAVQVKGYESSVGNAAVQQAVAGMRYYNCHRSAVMTNSRFTPSAVELARMNNCALIDETNLVAFVLGKHLL